MTKVLLSVAVVIVIIIAGGTTTHTSRVTETVTDVAAIPDLPTIHIEIPAPTDHPVASSDPLSLPTFGAPAGANGSSAASAHLAGDANAQVIEGTMTSPQPGTCTGMSHSSSSSENGLQVRTRHSHSFCSDEPPSDDCTQADCQDN